MTARATIAALSKPARGRLKRHVCGWCGQRLDRGYCSAIGEACSEETRLERVASCLADSRLPAVVEEAERLRADLTARGREDEMNSE